MIMFSIQDPTAIFASLVAVVAFLFWISRVEYVEGLFTFLPPIVWVCFVPTALTSLNILPANSVAYEWMSWYLLPFGIFLLTLCVDLPPLLTMGRFGLTMMLSGTLGIMAGCVIAFWIMRTGLPGDAWQSMTILASSWIGGAATKLATQQSLNAADSVMIPIIIVDTVVGYGWLGALIYLTKFKSRLDAAVSRGGTGTRLIQSVAARQSKPTSAIDIRSLSFILGLGLSAAVLGRVIGEALPELGDPVIVSGSTWTLLIVVGVGIILSMTPLRSLEKYGAGEVGDFSLYLLLAAIGASANFSSLLHAPLFLVAGFIILAVHVAFLVGAARIMGLPFVFVATASMANIGGVITAPIVADAYVKGMAPVGLIMGVLGNLIGLYAALALGSALARMAVF